MSLPLLPRLARAAMMAAVMIVLAAGCQTAPAPAGPAAQPGERYLCCNLRFERDWASDANFWVGSLIPAGSRVSLLDVRGRTATFDYQGQRYRLGQEYGTAQESFDAFLGKYLLTADPAPGLLNHPPAVQDAIRRGTLRRGMSKEQVIQALGYPPTHQTSTLAALEWTYWYNRFARFIVRFGPDERLVDVVTDPAMKRLLLPETAG